MKTIRVFNKKDLIHAIQTARLADLPTTILLGKKTKYVIGGALSVARKYSEDYHKGHKKLTTLRRCKAKLFEEPR